MPGQEKRGVNACLVGCIGFIVIALAFTAVVIAGGYYLFGKTREAFTSPEPRELPAVEFTAAEAEAVLARAQAFEAALDDPDATAEIELTARDINVLLRSDPRLDVLADSVHVAIPEDTLIAAVSIPLDMVPGLGGRYLNGEAELGLAVENGRFDLSIKRLMVVGGDGDTEDLHRPLMGAYLVEMETALNEELNTNPEARALAERVEEISVQDGRVRIRLKGER